MPTNDGPALRVLLVEDHPDLAMVTEEFLVREGLDVRTAMSGQEALEVARTFRPQLVLCDLNLPDMTGLDVIRGLRTDPSTEGTYAVILTAMREREVTKRREGEEPRVDAIVPKPITSDTVRMLVEHITSR
jgi:CheY-like chemotaxis protein